MSGSSFNLLGGYKIPAVGFGTFTITDVKLAEDALDEALKTGYRHIDTAQLYKNEHLIGNVLKKWFDSGKLKREDIFVTTKLPPSGLHPDRVESFLKQSLKDLQLDYVDLYLIHLPVGAKPLAPGSPFYLLESAPTDHIATWKKLEEQVDLGRTKTIGVSNFTIKQLSRLIANSKIKPVTNQIELHVYLQQPELVKYCQDNDIVVVSYSTLGNPGIGDFMEKQGVKMRERVSLLSDPTVNNIAKKHNKSAAQILLKFCVQKNIGVIPKSSTPSRIRENFQLFDFTLDENDVKSLEALDKGEEGRMNDLAFNKSFLEHPEYPFSKKSQ